MITKARGITATLIALVLIPTTYAENLMQVYQQALQNDPTYQQAISSWESAKVDLSIARSYYLPNVYLQGDYSQINYSDSSDNTLKDSSTQLASVSQQIFNYTYWNTLKQANYSVKAATATYFSAQQDLMQRTATAYFNVLTASETLEYDRAYKNELYNQLVTNRQKYKVGLLSSVDVYTTEASYDAQVAKEIADQNTLRANIEALASITKHHYKALDGIGASVPLLTPKPNNINQWVTTATNQNYSLKAQHYTTLAAQKNIKVQAGAAVPYLYASASAVHDQSLSSSSSGENYTTAGLTLAYTPFAGGLNYANAKQARYDYLTSTGLLEYDYRYTVQNTRTAFLGVISNISKIKADQKGVTSSEKSLQATKAGYQVGTEDIEDVLTSLSQLYQSKQSMITDQYGYLNELISLEINAGTLSTDDLKTINGWLKKPVAFKKILSNQKTTTNSTSNAAARTITPNPPTTTPQSQAAIQPSTYTVQLYASQNINDAKHYQQNMPNNQDTNVIKVGPWYKVIYGNFSNKTTARNALTQTQKINSNAWIYRLPNQYVTLTQNNSIKSTGATTPKKNVKLPIPS